MMTCTVGTMKIQPTKYIKVNQTATPIKGDVLKFNKVSNNDIIAKAIQSLDSLHDQIVGVVYDTRHTQFDVEQEFSPKDREALKSSLALMRRLLVDAQMRFRKMVEDNRKLAARIDGSIQVANKEMFMLRQELDDTNRRLLQIRDVNLVNGSSTKIRRTPSAASVDNMKKSDADNQIIKLKEENKKMEAELKKLRAEIVELRATKRALTEQPRLTNIKMELLQYQNELVRAKDALQALKTDRKRLKAEKVDLLCQMKQLYESVEDKETELRDFVHKYEQQGRQAEQTIKQLESCEQEKWTLIKRAQAAAENCVRLQEELNARDAEMLILSHKLDQAQTQIRELTSVGDMAGGCDVHDPSGAFSTSILSNDDLEDSGRTGSTEDVVKQKKFRKKKSSFGSLSRLFGKVKNRRSIAIGEQASLEGNLNLDVLSAENVNEKMQTARQLRHTPVTEWNAQQVLAWLEITMNMPQYGEMCAKHIHSGRMLCELNDDDLETLLGMSDYMHRKKFRLAIHELKTDNVEFPAIGELDTMWICEILLPDLGLLQYRSVFDKALIDGRVLINLTRRELDKYLNVVDKLHQNSIMAAIELLRRVQCNKQILSQRRAESLVGNTDPMMWPNQRLKEWLEKYIPKDSDVDFKRCGLHGALFVLDPVFNADKLSAVLGVCGDEKKQLSDQYDKLIKPARAKAVDVNRAFDRSIRGLAENPMKRLSLKGSLGRAFGRKARPCVVPEENGDLTNDGGRRRSRSHELILNSNQSP